MCKPPFRMNRLLVACAATLLFALDLGAQALLSHDAPLDLVVQENKDREEANEISKAIGGKAVTFHETENFVWVASMPLGKLTKITAEAEACYKLFADQAGIKDWKELWAGDRKCMGVILGNKADYKRYVRWYAEKYPVWNKQQFQNEHSSSMWFQVPVPRNVMVTHLKPNDEDTVAAVMCHLMGHLVVDRYKFNNNFTPGWLRESMGVYFQGEVHGKMLCGNYQDPYGLGSGDQNRQKGLKKSDYRSRAKKEMAGGRLRNLKTFFSLQVENELEFEDTLKGHILLSWMLKEKGKLPEFIAEMKKRWPGDINSSFSPDKEKAQNEALKAVYDIEPEKLDRELTKFASRGY